MPEINIFIDRNSPQHQEAIAYSMALLTATSVDSDPVTSTLVAGVVKSELELINGQPDEMERLVQYSFAFASLASAAVTAGYIHGRQVALADGEASPDLPDMEYLAPVIADVMRQWIPPKGGE